MFDIGSRVRVMIFSNSEGTLSANGTVTKVTYTSTHRWYSVHFDGGSEHHGIIEGDVSAL